MSERTNLMQADKKTELDVLDAIVHDAAMRDAEEGISTPEQCRAAEAAHAAVHERLAAMRRNLLPDADPPVVAKPVRASLLALGRDALLSRLEHLTKTMGGAVQYAHRDLDRLTDDDLRRLLDIIEPPTSTTE